MLTFFKTYKDNFKVGCKEKFDILYDHTGCIQIVCNILFGSTRCGHIG